MLRIILNRYAPLAKTKAILIADAAFFYIADMNIDDWLKLISLISAIVLLVLGTVKTVNQIILHRMERKIAELELKKMQNEHDEKTNQGHAAES